MLNISVIQNLAINVKCNNIFVNNNKEYSCELKFNGFYINSPIGKIKFIINILLI